MSNKTFKIKKEPEYLQIPREARRANIEIITLICEFLNKSTLPAFARATRAFTEPALNSLWKAQEDLVPLIQCFPRDLWMRIPQGGKDVRGDWELLMFRRPLSPKDWPRFDFYARRIHRLEGVHHTRSQQRCDIHPNAFTELASYRPPRTLLPNLQAIIYNQSWLTEFASTSFGQILLGQNLTEVLINATDIPERGGEIYSSLETLCATVQRLCPNIKTLSFLNLERAPIRAMPAIYQLIGSQKQLNSLSMKSATPSEELIAHLAKLPNLHTLVYVRIPPVHAHFYTTRDEQFPSLHTLMFETPNWIQAALVVAAMRRPLRSLSVRTLDTEPVTALGPFTKSLISHPALTKLVYLNLTGPRLHLNDPLDGPQVLRILHSLFSCSALRQVQLHSPVLQELDDTWLEGVAKAWPGLTSLSVTIAPTRTASRMTLQGIIPLIKSCPLLDTLCLPLHASPIDWKLLNGVRNQSITKISFEHSTITHPGLIFRALIAMFPNLSGVGHLHTEKDGINDQHYLAWKSVNELLFATSHIPLL